MNTPMLTIEQFEALEPQIVKDYLRHQQWQKQADQGAGQEFENYEVWRKEQAESEGFVLLLPLKRDLMDFADRMYDVVRSLSVAEQRSEAEILNDLISAAYLARAQERDILNLHFYFSEAATYSPVEAPAKRLGAILTTFQDTLDAIGEVKAGRANPYGRIAGKITEQTQLSILTTFRGSFGLRLAVMPSLIQPDLFEVPLAESSLESLIQLLNGSDQDEQLQELLMELKRRCAGRYRKFLQAIVDAETDVQLEWGSPVENKGGVARLSSETALRALGTVTRMEVEAPEDFLIKGPLLSASTTSQTFEIRDMVENKTYSGRCADGVLGSHIDITLNKTIYTAKIQEMVKMNQVTGEGRIEYRLTELRPWGNGQHASAVAETA